MHVHRQARAGKRRLPASTSGRVRAAFILAFLPRAARAGFSCCRRNAELGVAARLLAAGWGCQQGVVGAFGQDHARPGLFTSAARSKLRVNYALVSKFS